MENGSDIKKGIKRFIFLNSEFSKKKKKWNGLKNIRYLKGKITKCSDWGNGQTKCI